jgi:hypothetical protein
MRRLRQRAEAALAEADAIGQRKQTEAELDAANAACAQIRARRDAAARDLDRGAEALSDALEAEAERARGLADFEQSGGVRPSILMRSKPHPPRPAMLWKRRRRTLEAKSDQR